MNIRILLVAFLAVCSCATRKSNELDSIVRSDESRELKINYLPGHNFVFVSGVKNLPIAAWNLVQSQFTRPFLQLLELSGLVLVSARGGPNFTVGLFCKDQTDCQRKVANLNAIEVFKISEYVKVFPVLELQNKNSIYGAALGDTAWLNDPNGSIFVEFQASLADFENREAFANDLESIGRQGGASLPEPLVPQLTTYTLPFFAQTKTKSLFLISKCSESKYCENAAVNLKEKAEKIGTLSVFPMNEFSGTLAEGEPDRERIPQLIKGKGGLEPGNSRKIIADACQEPAYNSFMIEPKQENSKEYYVNPTYSELVKEWQREITDVFLPTGLGYLVIKFQKLFRFDELQKMYDALGALGANHREFDSLTSASSTKGRGQAHLPQNRRELYKKCGLIDLERDLNFLVTESLKSERLSLSYTQVRRFTAADPVAFSTFHADNAEHVTLTLALWGNGTFVQREDGSIENADFLDLFIFSGTKRKKPTLHAAPDDPHDRLVILMRFNP